MANKREEPTVDSIVKQFNKITEQEKKRKKEHPDQWLADAIQKLKDKKDK